MPPSTPAPAAPVAAPPPAAPPSPDSAVLALDLGTTTGWALRAADGLVTSGTVSFRPGRYDGGGMRYLRFTNWLPSWTGCPGPSRRSGSRRSAATPGPTRRMSTAGCWPR